MRVIHLLPLTTLALLVGCKTYNAVVPHDPAIQLVDEGTLKTFRPVDIDYSPPFSSRHVRDTYLIPDQVRKFDKVNADWAVSFSPPWLRSATFDTARWISANEPPTATRWLVSANPTVVAIGPATSEPSGIRPITLSDLDQPVTRLLILNPWQPPTQGDLRPPPPPGNLRTLDLQHPKPLRQLLQQTPWLSPR